MSRVHFQTQRLWLTPWQLSDFVAFRPIAQDPKVMRYITRKKPWPDSRIREFIGRQMRYAKLLGFCMWSLHRKPDGRLIGLCGLQPLTLGIHREVEIGWWLTSPNWGRGLATEAARAAITAARKRFGLRRIVATAMPENRASTRVMQHIGMHYERRTTRRGFNGVVYSSLPNPRA